MPKRKIVLKNNVFHSCKFILRSETSSSDSDDEHENEIMPHGPPPRDYPRQAEDPAPQGENVAPAPELNPERPEEVQVQPVQPQVLPEAEQPDAQRVDMLAEGDSTASNQQGGAGENPRGGYHYRRNRRN